MVVILVSFWEGLFSGAMLVSGRVAFSFCSVSLTVIDLKSVFFVFLSSFIVGLNFFGYRRFEDLRSTRVWFKD